MVMKRLAMVAVLVAGCGVEKEQAECGSEDVDIILDCGPQSDRITDSEGREIDFCKVPTGEGRECTFANVHCMPRSYCESRCPNGEFVCD